MVDHYMKWIKTGDLHPRLNDITASRFVGAS